MEELFCLFPMDAYWGKTIDDLLLNVKSGLRVLVAGDIITLTCIVPLFQRLISVITHFIYL